MITNKLSSCSSLIILVPSYGLGILLIASMMFTGRAHAHSLASNAAMAGRATDQHLATDILGKASGMYYWQEQKSNNSA